MHFKFLNAVALCAQALNLPKDHENSAYRFHQDMFASGIERIIAVRIQSVTEARRTHDRSIGGSESLDDLLPDSAP